MSNCTNKDKAHKICVGGCEGGCRRVASQEMAFTKASGNLHEQRVVELWREKYEENPND